MSLLSLEDVTKRYRRGRREHMGLSGLSMTVECEELVVVIGPRQSGRSTLARVASGVEGVDEGSVTFEGRDLRASRRLVGRRIVLCSGSFSSLAGETVLDHVATALLARHSSLSRARRVAAEMLAKVDAAGCSSMRPSELDQAERVRVSIARALVAEPRMIVLDDPTRGLGMFDSDSLLRLLRSIVDSGVSVLVCSDDTACLAGSDRALMLDAGRLRGEVKPRLAEVVSLRSRPLEQRVGEQGGARV